MSLQSNSVVEHPNASAIDAVLDAALNGGAEDNPKVEEAAATKEEAQAAEDVSQAEGDEPKADEKPATSGGLDLVQKIIDSKYKGDAEAFTRGLYEQWNSSAKLARKVEELEQRLAEGTTPKPSAEEDTDIQWLSNRAQAADYTLGANVQRQNSIIAELDQVRVDAARLEGRIAATDDEQIKDRLERQKDRLDFKAEGLKNEFFTLKARNFDLEKEKYAATKMLADRQKLYAEKPKQQSEQSRPDTKWENNERTDFETSVFDVAVNAGLMPGTEDFEEFMENVKAKAIYEHHKNADQPAIDTVKFAKELATKELKRFKAAAFQSFSEQKAQASGTKLIVPQSAKGVAPTKPSAPRPTPTIPTGKMSLEQAKAHTARILGG